MTRGTVVIVTGSREWTDEAAIRFRLSRYPRGTILLHGDCRGADRIAANVGREMGFQVVGIPYFGDMGKAGGHVRNACLIAVGVAFKRFELGVTVEPFPLPQSVGTPNCMDQARSAGLDVRGGK